VLEGLTNGARGVVTRLPDITAALSPHGAAGGYLIVTPVRGIEKNNLDNDNSWVLFFFSSPSLG
jgi:hypothetical protein